MPGVGTRPGTSRSGPRDPGLQNPWMSVCEHYWSIERWIHSQRRNRLDQNLIQKLVEKLVRTHTDLVLRESLDDTLRDLLQWDILVIDETVDEKEEEPES
jgi:hypothetical protein